MDYLEQARHWNTHIELRTRADQAERHVRDLEKMAALAPSAELYEKIQAAKAELQTAREKLREHGSPDHEESIIATPFGGFRPHWPESRRQKP